MRLLPGACRRVATDVLLELEILRFSLSEPVMSLVKATRDTRACSLVWFVEPSDLERRGRRCLGSAAVNVNGGTPGFGI